MISVLVLTRNEERDLPGCLASMAWCDDVHVYDCHSADATASIARAAGASVHVRRDVGVDGIFGGDEAAYRNWGLRHIPFRHPWVLSVDADERVTPELAAAARAAVAAPGAQAGFLVRRRDFFMDAWLRRVQATPWHLRLFRPQRLRYERLVNPVAVIDGPVSRLDGFLDHFPFSKGLGHWIDRHNAYATLEACQAVAERRAGVRFSFREALLGRDALRRRVHQKGVFQALPARPLIKFLLLYVARLGFLDGRAGLTYAALQAVYEYFIVLKMRELERQEAQGRQHAVP